MREIKVIPSPPTKTFPKHINKYTNYAYVYKYQRNFNRELTGIYYKNIMLS